MRTTHNRRICPLDLASETVISGVPSRRSIDVQGPKGDSSFVIDAGGARKAAVMLAGTASRPWVGRHADQVDLRAHSPLITGLGSLCQVPLLGRRSLRSRRLGPAGRRGAAGHVAAVSRWRSTGGALLNGTGRYAPTGPRDRRAALMSVMDTPILRLALPRPHTVMTSRAIGAGGCRTAAFSQGMLSGSGTRPGGTKRSHADASRDSHGGSRRTSMSSRPSASASASTP